MSYPYPKPWKVVETTTGGHNIIAANNLIVLSVTNGDRAKDIVKSVNIYTDDFAIDNPWRSLILPLSLDNRGAIINKYEDVVTISNSIIVEAVNNWAKIRDKPPSYKHPLNMSIARSIAKSMIAQTLCNHPDVEKILSNIDNIV